MISANKKAKVSAEHVVEARRLLAIWRSKKHESQAAFGEKYEIGNQSAVGQFLRGEAPLSMKAATGFAKGLGCQIGDFSTRLAMVAAEASLVNRQAPHQPGDWPFLTVTPEQYFAIPKANRDIIEATVNAFVAREPPEKQNEPAFSTTRVTKAA